MLLLSVQVVLQPGPRPLAASQQELCGSACGAVHQPHRQLQDGRAGDRGPGGSPVSVYKLNSQYNDDLSLTAGEET